MGEPKTSPWTRGVCACPFPCREHRADGHPGDVRRESGRIDGRQATGDGRARRSPRPGGLRARRQPTPVRCSAFPAGLTGRSPAESAAQAASAASGPSTASSLLAGVRLRRPAAEHLQPVGYRKPLAVPVWCLWLDGRGHLASMVEGLFCAPLAGHHQAGATMTVEERSGRKAAAGAKLEGNGRRCIDMGPLEPSPPCPA